MFFFPLIHSNCAQLPAAVERHNKVPVQRVEWVQCDAPTGHEPRRSALPTTVTPWAIARTSIRRAPCLTEAGEPAAMCTSLCVLYLA